METRKEDILRFPVDDYTLETVEFNGENLVRKAYMHLQYVENPVDADYQSLNVFIPVSYGDKTFDVTNAPILFMNRCSGYRSAINRGEMKRPMMRRPPMQPDPNAPRIGPAVGRVGKMVFMGDSYTNAVLASGIILVVPGSRGRDNQFPNGKYYGKAPATIIDLKAAVRYLRHNADLIPGDMEHIISKGSSAGGGMSALLSSSGNDDEYAPYLKELGAADERDDVFAGICISPVLDLEHQDMGYEWQYGKQPLYGFDGVKKPPVDQELSQQLAAMYEKYMLSLNLTCRKNYGKLTPETYRDYYLNEFLIPSATRWLSEQDEETRKIYLEDRPWLHWDGEKASFTTEDYETYLGRLKMLAPFDSFELGQSENSLFGNETEDARHYTDFSLRYTSGDLTAKVSDEIMQLRDLMNPMLHIKRDSGVRAKHWWIRMATKECGFTSSLVVNFATSLENLGDDVNFRLVWDGGHCAEDDTDEQIQWMHDITGYKA